VDARSARKLIEECFPEIRIRRARQLLTGRENLILEVNGEYVFRFPRFSETEKRLRREIGLLSKLRGHLSVPVPDYKFVWKGDRKHPHWFGGYPKLRGETISDRVLGTRATRQLARQVSRFLKELHSTGIQSRRLHVPEYSPGEWVNSIRLQRNRIRRIIYPLLRPELRNRSEKFWQGLLSDFANADFKPTLIHGDLSTENILFDPETLELTGILDWGYAQVSDPALEFAHLFMHNPTFGKEVLRIYGKVGQSFEQRVQWYVRSEPFYDIMWGVEHHWQKAKTIGMANLTKELREMPDQHSH